MRVPWVLLLAGVALAAPETVDLGKFDAWRAKAGDAWRVSSKADGMAGYLVPLAYEYTFEERVDEVDDAGRPRRWTRTYAKFEDQRLEAPLDLAGRKLLFKREGDAPPRFGFEGPAGWEAPAFLRERLDEELNESAAFSPDAWRPKEPVAVGGEWPLPREAVGWLLGSLLTDLELQRATARLEGVSERSGTRWATVSFQVRGVLSVEGEKVETELRMTVSAPLDGSSPAREEKATMCAGKHTRVDWTIVREAR